MHPVLGVAVNIHNGDVFAPYKKAALTRAELLQDPLAIEGNWNSPPYQVIAPFLAKSLTLTVGALGLTYGGETAFDEPVEMRRGVLCDVAADSQEDAEIVTCSIQEDDVRGVIFKAGEDGKTTVASYFEDASQFLMLRTGGGGEYSGTKENLSAIAESFPAGTVFYDGSSHTDRNDEAGEIVPEADRTVETTVPIDPLQPELGNEPLTLIMDEATIDNKTATFTANWGSAPIYFSAHRIWMPSVTISGESTKSSEMPETSDGVNFYRPEAPPVVGGNPDEVIYAFPEVVAFVDGFYDDHPTETANTETSGHTAYSTVAFEDDDIRAKDAVPSVTITTSAENTQFVEFLTSEL